MQDADQGSAGELVGEGLRIGIVRARFNAGDHRASWPRPAWPNWTGSAWQERDIKHVTVPGALEIPLALKALADSRASSTRSSRWAA